MTAEAFGYAAIFGEEATIGGLFREKLRRGCFANSLEQGDIRALYDHDTGRVIGRTKSGTLRLQEDPIGLRFELDVEESTPDGQTVMALVGRQDVSQCSFGFRVVAEEWRDEGEDTLPLRIITEVELFEVSIVAWPAYDTTSVQLSARKTHNRDGAFRRRSESWERAKTAMRRRGISV
ncbi:Phage prohead protease (Modular protein) [Devosia sp. LC5]|uniref:HK97 family phage prohead protease n=1 Tax=Devosia sp. LC5 TaxID=1502724 RepID=UPI0004E3DEEE|nr:HK97 family phage prohead protease [Devosia sp. LC5]KFC68433.1 Phage prohead protease (Modular protein) [Devosia sp. LC5]